MDNREYLTQDRHDKLVKELDFLKHDKRTEIARSLEYAKSLGDLSENAEYHEARDAQAALEDRISHLEAILKNAVIVSLLGSDVVSAGSEITIRKEGDKSEKTFTLVGSEETDAALGKISVKSPLGKAALGKKKNESFSFETPGGVQTYTVVNIK